MFATAGLERKTKQSEREKPGYSYTKTRVYQRSEYVVESVERRAKGICELCEQEAPFKNPNGKPYLEVHHIVQLAKGGPDTIDNAVALCPNCHSLTKTWRGRNKSKKSGGWSDLEILEAYKNNRNIRQTLLSLGMAAKGGNYNRVKRILERNDLMFSDKLHKKR